MRTYKQLCLRERIEIAALRDKGVGVNKIAAQLGRSKSTISRELKRNCFETWYWPESAHRHNHYRRRKNNMLEGNDGLRIFVIHKLTRARWTPEQISGYLKYRQTDLQTVSHETIYKWIYSLNQLANKYWKFLPRHKRKRGLPRINSTDYKDSPHRLSIHQRPAEISSRQEFGHWEGDLMSFIHNSQHALVLHERKTRYVQSVVLDNKQASTTSVALMGLMLPLPASSRKTLTLDNGGEFTTHQDWKRMGLTSYFCDPYAAWQKGGVENSNGRLRRLWPRSFDIFSIRGKEFAQMIDNHNSTPRKSLDWRSPAEVFEENLSHLKAEEKSCSSFMSDGIIHP